MSGRGIRGEIAALLRAYPRVQIWLIAAVAFGGIVCMAGAVIALALSRS